MRRLILLVLLASLVVVVAATVWLALALRPERVREHLITAVSDRFAARVEADSAEIAILPRPAISGSRLRIHLRDAGDAPPLISVNAFDASAPVSGLIGPKVHLGNVRLSGTDIRIPPGGLKPAVESLDRGSLPSRDGSPPSRPESRTSIVIDEIVSRDAPSRARHAQAQQAATGVRDSRCRDARVRPARGRALHRLPSRTRFRGDASRRPGRSVPG